MLQLREIPLYAAECLSLREKTREYPVLSSRMYGIAKIFAAKKIHGRTPWGADVALPYSRKQLPPSNISTRPYEPRRTKQGKIGKNGRPRHATMARSVGVDIPEISPTTDSESECNPRAPNGNPANAAAIPGASNRKSERSFATKLNAQASWARRRSTCSPGTNPRRIFRC